MTTNQDQPAQETRRIVAMIAAGKTDRQIANELFVSDRTLRRHLRKVMIRLGASNRAHLVRIAHDLGWLANQGDRSETDGR